MDEPDTQPRGTISPSPIPDHAPSDREWLTEYLDDFQEVLEKERDFLNGIRNWVAFLGILVIISLVFSACNAILSAGR